MKYLIPALILAALLLTPIRIAAQTTDTDEQLLAQQLEQVGADGLDALLDQQTRQLLEQLGIDSADPAALLSATPESLAQVVLALTQKSYPAPLKAFLSLSAVLIVCHILTAVNNNRNLTFNAAFDWFSAVCGGVILLAPLIPVISETVQQIRLSADFMAGFVPVFCAAVSASGQPTAAALSSGWLLTVSQLAVRLNVDLAVPLCGVFAAFGIVAGLSKNFGLERLSSLAKSTVLWGLGAVTALLVGFLSLKSTVAAAGDSLTLRTAKLLVSGSVPVIGSGLSDAVATVFSSMKIVKTAVGVYGMAAAVLYLLPALIEITLWRLCVSLSGFAAGAGGNENVAKLCKALGDMLSVLTAVTALTGLGFLLSVVSVLRLNGGGS